ncbi:MAG: hypothetical protein ACRCV9_03970, partial [Burkholderiaceae bacterium]
LAKKSNQKKARPHKRGTRWQARALRAAPRMRGETPHSALRVPKSVKCQAAGKKTRCAQTVFARHPRLALACLGASEGYATCGHRAVNKEVIFQQIQVPLRIIHAPFQPFLPAKAHEYCVNALEIYTICPSSNNASPCIPRSFFARCACYIL